MNLDEIISQGLEESLAKEKLPKDVKHDLTWLEDLHTHAIKLKGVYEDAIGIAKDSSMQEWYKKGLDDVESMIDFIKNKVNELKR